MPLPRTAEEIKQIEMLVRSAVGADSLRGDVVSVVSMPFAPTATPVAEAPKTDVVKVIQTAQRPLLGVVGLALILVVAMLSLKSLKGNVPAAPAAAVMTLPRNDSTQPQMLAAAPNIPVVMPTNTMRDKVNSTIEQQPEIAARVVRAMERLASNRLELMKDVAGKVTRRLCRVLHARLRISAELPSKFGDVMRQARDLVALSCP